ncbi:MAG: VWA domain-containing protein [Pirellulaceae bacterium]|nr:VWA domain-containing protein [Pirellulaceae bacterium]
MTSSHPTDDKIVNPDAEVDAWDEDELEEEPVLQTDESSALIGSVLVHLILILALALAPLSLPVDEDAVVLVSPPTNELTEEIKIIEDVTYEEPSEEIGASSEADMAMAEASAEVFSEIPEISNPLEMEQSDFANIMANQVFTPSSAPMDRFTERTGKTGVQTAGAVGAIDRLTFEILQSLEERNTLVVWLFDQSGSLHQQRARIRDRFDQIYTELGITSDTIDRDKQKRGLMNHDAPLLTSIIGFGGKQPMLFTDPPTEDVDEIKKILDNIEIDTSGVENVFTAVSTAADKYKTLRRSRGGQGPQRNVMFVVVTDERGDDEQQLENAIKTCRGSGIPVYVIGVPAPFGRKHTLVKYVDPDPKYDQSPQFAQVDQGPETLVSEYVQVGFTGDFKDEKPIDSGFGPYALTRLCYETGGIYFSVHPNRSIDRDVGRRELSPFASELTRFFDAQAMEPYRPDYLSPGDYRAKVESSPLRRALVSAANQVKPVGGIRRPVTRFVQVDVARLAGDLTVAQQDAAKLEPTLARLAQILEPGMKHREEEPSPRWRAGYDLAMGRVLAQKVRTETYNAMLAKAKRGMTFEKEKNNTWVLEPSEEISVGSKWQREAETAKMLLETVVKEHEGTPWAYLAKQELTVPIGWKWEESFTDTTPRPNRAGNNNNNNNPTDDKKKMLKKAPKRPVPKL